MACLFERYILQADDSADLAASQNPADLAAFSDPADLAAFQNPVFTGSLAGLEKTVEAYDSWATIGSLIFGFGISIMYDALKDDVEESLDDKPMKVAFVVLGMIVLAASMLPTLVLAFRAGMVRRMLSWDSCEQARDFTTKTSHMTLPCIVGIMVSAFGLFAQIMVLLQQRVSGSLFITASLIAGPFIILTIKYMTQIFLHKVENSPKEREGRYMEYALAPALCQSLPDKM